MSGTKRILSVLLALLIALPMLGGTTALADSHTERDRGSHPNHDACGPYSVTTWGHCRCGKVCYCWYGICSQSGVRSEYCTVHPGGTCGDYVYTLDEVYLPEKAVKINAKSVELSASGTVTLNLGESLTLTAAVNPSWMNGDVTWSTSNQKVASVADGVVYGHKEGTVTITVKAPGNRKDTVKVKVVDPYKPTAIVLDQEGTLDGVKGETIDLSYTLKPADARSEITWTTSSSKLATVEDGVVTCLGEGTVTITAKTYNGKSDTVKIKIIDPYKPDAIVLDQEGTVYVRLGEELQLSHSLRPDTAIDDNVSWKSSSTKIATVEDGLVYGVKKGTVTITVTTYNGKKDTVKVKVVGETDPTAVYIEGDEILEGYKGEPIQLNAYMDPEDSVSKLTWSTSNKKVATVDSTGLVKPIKNGTAKITVKTSVGQSAVVTVNVVDKPPYADFDFELVGDTYTITGYHGYPTAMVIPEDIKGVKVTAIAAGAFRNNTTIKSATVPSGVTEIDDETFKGCTSLESIVLPNGITRIGKGAFSGCTSLKSGSTK